MAGGRRSATLETSCEWPTYGVTAVTKNIAVMAIPEDIREIWGGPPLLRNESAETSEKLAGQISQAVGPIDVIEWLWVKDVLDLSWEIRRLLRRSRQY
jgi:hypothetical protein